MSNFDGGNILNTLLLAFIPIVVLIATYYANHFIELQRRKHAEDKVEATITQAVALAVIEEQEPAKRMDKAVEYVEAVATTELRRLKVDPEVLRKKIEARVSTSRSMYF